MAVPGNSIANAGAEAARVSDAGSQDKYFSVVTVNHFHAKDVFLLSDYFIPRCTHYFLFTFGQSNEFGSSNSIQFSEYHRGKLVREKVIVRNQWAGGFFVRSIQLVFWFTLFALLVAPRRSWIMTPHPPVCLFQKALRILKQQKFVFIIADIFHYDSKDWSGAIFNKYIRYCARTIDHVFYMSLDIQKRHDVFADGERKPLVRKRWSLGIKRRFDDGGFAMKAQHMRDARTTTLGYVGVVRSCVGLESLIEYARLNENIRVDVVGEGCYAAELIKRCRDSGVDRRVIFHGYLATGELEALAAEWVCGTMLYDLDQTLYTRHTEPGKAKLYLSLGVPVLMTDVSYIVDEVRRHKAGIVLSGNDPVMVKGAVETLRRDYLDYANGVAAMAKEYDYQSKYDDDFAFMRQS